MWGGVVKSVLGILIALPHPTLKSVAGQPLHPEVSGGEGDVAVKTMIHVFCKILIGRTFSSFLRWSTALEAWGGGIEHARKLQLNFNYPCLRLGRPGPPEADHPFCPEGESRNAHLTPTLSKWRGSRGGPVLLRPVLWIEKQTQKDPPLGGRGAQNKNTRHGRVLCHSRICFKIIWQQPN